MSVATRPAAPDTPLPFRTRTEMRARGRSGGSAGPFRAGRELCSVRAPVGRLTSATTLPAASARTLAVSAIVPQGKGRPSGWTCSTDPHDSAPARPLLLPRIVRLVFVSFEGADGSGKSTQAELLRAALAAEGRDVMRTREPGGTELGDAIRALVLVGPAMTPWAEAALFAASRAQHVEEVIRPALDRGADVVCDRFVDSSLAYQGIGRGLGVDEVLELNLHATHGLMPDMTVLLLLDAGTAAARAGESDRLERAGDDFRRSVDAAYRELAERFPERIVTIDATGSPE